MNKKHTRNQKRMYRIHKQEEKIHDLELLIGTLQQENKKYKEVIDKAINFMKEYRKNQNAFKWNEQDYIDVIDEIDSILKEVK